MTNVNLANNRELKQLSRQFPASLGVAAEPLRGQTSADVLWTPAFAGVTRFAFGEGLLHGEGGRIVDTISVASAVRAVLGFAANGRPAPHPASRLGAPGLDRRNARAAPRRILCRRPVAGDRPVPGAEARASALSRRRGGRWQDGDRQGAGLCPPPQADPPAMLRGPRRGDRRVRVELPGSDDGDPPLRSRRRTRQGPHRTRRVFRTLPHQAAAACRRWSPVSRGRRSC